MAKISKSKLLKGIKEYYGVDAEYIAGLLKKLEEENGTMEKLILTEQFNLGYIEGMKDSARQLETYFRNNVETPIQDFKEIDSTANVENINQETNESKDNKSCDGANGNEEKDNLN